MIIIDASVWIAYLKLRDATRLRQSSNVRLGAVLAGEERQTVLMHPFVMGELALGGLSSATKALLDGFTPATVASISEVRALIERSLVGCSVGYTDAHLLASARLMRAKLWTLEIRLAVAAADLGCAY